ncbi:MAG: PHP domain-containing protein [Candidatus Helarchaeota archaeon]
MIDFHIHSYFSDGDQTPQEILEVAERRKLSAIAITDHCDISGHFMYLRNVANPRPLREYIDEFRSLPKEKGVNVFLGLELCDFSTMTNIPPEFSELDFLLVETFPAQTPQYKIFDPLEEAIKLKRHFSFPIGLAHPTLSDIEKNLDQLDKNNIFIELNNEKLLNPPKDRAQILQRTAELLHSSSNIRLSLGSDAHQIFLIGAVKPLWLFLIEHNFEDRLILINK